MATTKAATKKTTTKTKAASKTTTAKSKAETKPAAEKKAPAKTRGEKDQFGNGANTQCSKINAVLIAAKEPMTPKQIAEQSGASPVLVSNHLRTLMGKGHIVRTDDGYGQPTPRRSRAKSK